MLLFSDRSMKGGTSWISRDGGISEREEVDLETGGGGSTTPPPPPYQVCFRSSRSTALSSHSYV